MTTKITEKNISNIANAAVQWQSVVVADGSTGLTAVAGRGYFINTTSGAQTVTLPTSANVGDVIVLKDYARTWATNAVTIASTTLDGTTNNPSFSTNGQTVTLVYMDNTKGWSLINEDTTTSLGAQFVTATGGTILTDGNFKTHVFTGDGSFVVATAGNPAGSTGVDYLVVAGGGGGATGSYQGGGGAGGYRTSFPSPTSCSTGPFPITATTYPITVGSGGTGGPSPNTSGTSGSNSIFSTITSTGGGSSNSSPLNGSPGGSGGGGRSDGSGPGTGGSGNAPPTSPPQGNPGGTGGTPSGGYGGGGGGGAGAAGTTGAPPAPATAGSGGIGSTISDTFFGPTAPSYGTPGPAPGRYFAGGGGGANDANLPYSLTTALGAGGAGGGGRSGQPDFPNVSPGPEKGRGSAAGGANTGGGGGGGAYCGGNVAGSAGGKGIVIIRYKFQ